MLQIYKNIGILVFILCFVNVAVSKKDKDKKKKNCTKIVWELQNATLVHNTTGVLKRGDGYWKIVHVEHLHNGLGNVTSSIETCCEGFEENDKGKCKRCKKDRYGVNCSMKCNCEEGQTCDHVDGCIAINTSTTTVNRLTVNTTQATGQSTTSTDLFTDRTINHCLICEAAKNCTSDLNCTDFQSSGIECKKGWYGVNCSLKCVCERHQKCDHKVGCLGRIRKSHLSAKDKEQHISTYSTTALINHSLTKNKVTEGPEKMTTFGWKDTTLVRGKEVSIEDSIVTGKESQNENIHDVYIIIVVALCIIVSVLIVTICGRESFRYFNLFERRKRRNLGDISVRRNTEENLYSDVHHNSNAYITMTDGIPVNTVAQTTQITSATENRASISPY